jgi:hypothetical protein
LQVFDVFSHFVFTFVLLTRGEIQNQIQNPHPSKTEGRGTRKTN